MNTSTFTIFLVVLNISSLSSCKQKKAEVQQAVSTDRPNIVLIMADDLGYETLGVYGSDSYQTPHLDQLAEEGIRFNHCYATPLCTPSRVQLMTGKYNFRNYIGFGLLDPKEKTFGNYMQDAGYETLITGKWQLLGSTRQQALAGGKKGTYPEDAGFDDYCLWQIDSLGSRYKDPLLSIKGKTTQAYPGQFGPDMFVEHIEKFMESHKEDPFFVYYPMAITHDPFVPTPNNPEFEDFDAKAKINDPNYFGEMVSYMDQLVGRIVAKTEALGIREKTLILFVGDNGTDRKVTSNIGGVALKGNKGFTTNAGTHVPFIANWKGKIQGNMVNDNLIDFTDFLPSILEAADYSTPEGTKKDGVSFFPQLLGQTAATRDWIFCHYDPNWGKFGFKRYVQDRRWKLYASGDFYDLEQDPLEQHPLQIDTQSDRIKLKIKTFEQVLETYQN